MAYKVSYKVVSEQGEQLRAIAKDMDAIIARQSTADRIFFIFIALFPFTCNLFTAE